MPLDTASPSTGIGDRGPGLLVKPISTTEGSSLRRALGGRGIPGVPPLSFPRGRCRRNKPTAGCWTTLPLVTTRGSLGSSRPLGVRSIPSQHPGEAHPQTSLLLDLPDQELAKALGAVSANHRVSAVRVLGLLLRHRRGPPALSSHSRGGFPDSFGACGGSRSPLAPAPQHGGGSRPVQGPQPRGRGLVGLFRIGVPDYSERAFGEALANALIHRDFTRLGAVHAQWRDDQIEISNPGGFPEGVRLDNLLVTPPRPRNPLLADAFKRAGLVERTARGIDTIFYEQLRNGRPAPDYQRSTQTMSCSASQEARPILISSVSSPRRVKRDARPPWMRCFSLTRSGRNGRLIPPRRPGAFKIGDQARAVLSSLVESGLVESRGNRRGRIYHLSAAAYRGMGDKAAYIRQRGFEPIQQEQMVLQFVQRHGSISRSEAAELCRITDPQAYRLLRRLVEHASLKRSEGQGRSARYKAPD